VKPPQQASLDFSTWPKIDLHRHLAGAIRFSTWRELVGKDHPSHSMSEEELLQHLTITEVGTLTSYLTRFAWLDMCFTGPEAFERVTYEAIADAAADGLVYVEIRFSPARFTQLSGLTIEEVLLSICRGRDQAVTDYPIQAGLIAGLSREMGFERCRETAGIIASFAGRGLAAIDLLGEERNYPPHLFAPIFAPLASEGALGITIHAGEDSPPEYVRDSILLLGAQRIGHGIRAVDSLEVMDLLVKRQVVVETCPTSNLHTAAVSSLAEHPLPVFLDAGVRATINTDNPRVSLTTLTHEYELASQQMGLTPAQLARATLHAAEGVFAPLEVREALVARIRFALDSYLA
jgi:adenosine deaminase